MAALTARRRGQLNMKEIQKPVRRKQPRHPVPCSRAAVAGSGVAQAQECFAFPSGANTVRAEGMTEAVGSIQIAVQGPRSLWPAAHSRYKAVISIELNTAITNATNDDDVVQGLTYTFPGGGADLGAEANL